MKLIFLIIELSLFCSILNLYQEYKLTNGILTYLGTLNKNDIIKLYIDSKFGQSVDIILNFDSEDSSNRNTFMNIQEYKDSSKINENKFIISKKYSDLTLKFISLKEYEISSELCNYLLIEIMPNEQMLNVDIKATIKEKPQIIKSNNQNDQSFESDNSYKPLIFESDEDDDDLFEGICGDDDDNDEDDNSCGIAILVILIIVIIVAIFAGIYFLFRHMCNVSCRRNQSDSYSNSNYNSRPLYPTDL